MAGDLKTDMFSDGRHCQDWQPLGEDTVCERDNRTLSLDSERRVTTVSFVLECSNGGRKGSWGAQDHTF